MLSGTSIGLPLNRSALDLALLLFSSQVTEAHLIQMLRPGNPFIGKNTCLLQRTNSSPCSGSVAHLILLLLCRSLNTAAVVSKALQAAARAENDPDVFSQCNNSACKRDHMHCP